MECSRQANQNTPTIKQRKNQGNSLIKSAGQRQKIITKITNKPNKQKLTVEKLSQPKDSVITPKTKKQLKKRFFVLCCMITNRYSFPQKCENLCLVFYLLTRLFNSFLIYIHCSPSQLQ